MYFNGTTIIVFEVGASGTSFSTSGPASFPVIKFNMTNYVLAIDMTCMRDGCTLNPIWLENVISVLTLAGRFVNNSQRITQSR